MEHVLLNLL